MDLVEIGCSGLLSAAIFVFLEFTIILPMIRRIVEHVLNDSLIPSLKSYVEEQKAALMDGLTRSIMTKVRGMIGGRAKGSNALVKRLLAGEDIEALEDDYSDAVVSSTVDQLMDVLPDLAGSLSRYLNGKKENNKDNQDNQDNPFKSFES